MTGRANEGAFYWDSATGLIDIGAPSGLSTGGFEINNSGWIVGQANFKTGTHAFLYRNEVERLPVPGNCTSSIAWSINNFGTIVGRCQDFSFPIALKWDADVLDTTFRINDPEFLWAQISNLFDVNDAEQIVGVGAYRPDNSANRGFRLDPVFAAPGSNPSASFIQVGLLPPLQGQLRNAAALSAVCAAETASFQAIAAPERPASALADEVTLTRPLSAFGSAWDEGIDFSLTGGEEDAEPQP